MRNLHLRISLPVRALITTCFCSIIIVIVAVSIQRKVRAIEEPFNERAFDALIWRAVSTREQAVQRARMADSLRRTLYAGMTEKQVKMLLGAPDVEGDATSYVAASQSKGVHKMFQYDMGYAPLDIAGQHFLFRLYFDSTEHYLFSEITKD